MTVSSRKVGLLTSGKKEACLHRPGNKLDMSILKKKKNGLCTNEDKGKFMKFQIGKKIQRWITFHVSRWSNWKTFWKSFLNYQWNWAVRNWLISSLWIWSQQLFFSNPHKAEIHTEKYFISNHRKYIGKWD